MLPEQKYWRWCFLNEELSKGCYWFLEGTKRFRFKKKRKKPVAQLTGTEKKHVCGSVEGLERDLL